MFHFLCKLHGLMTIVMEQLAYTTATAMRDPSHVCDLHHSSPQCRILNPLREARDRTRNLMVPSQIRFHCSMMGTPDYKFKVTGKEECTDDSYAPYV